MSRQILNILFRLISPSDRRVLPKQPRKSSNTSRTHRTMINCSTQISKWWSFTAMPTRQRATMKPAMCHHQMAITFISPNARPRRREAWRSDTTMYRLTASRPSTSTPPRQSHTRRIHARADDGCQLQFLIRRVTLAVRSAVSRPCCSPSRLKRQALQHNHRHRGPREARRFHRQHPSPTRWYRQGPVSSKIYFRLFMIH